MNNKLKEILKDKGITIEELSQSTGIGRTTIYQIMNYKCITNVEYALRISSHLKIPVDEIFISEE